MALVHIGFFSEALGMCVSCDVILPQKSTALIGMKTASTEAPAKVLYLLHGASDDETVWQRRTSIERYAAPLGLAVVMPAAQLSSYADMAHGGRYFTYIADELPAQMRRFFGFSDRREDNYIAGLSMGGAGCLKIGLARADRFCAIGCLSAGLSNFRKATVNDERFAKRRLMVHGDRPEDGALESAAEVVRALTASGGPFPRIYHACGKSDFLIDTAHATRDLFSEIPGNPFDYTYEEDEGAHTWEYWDEHIQHFLKFIALEKQQGILN